MSETASTTYDVERPALGAARYEGVSFRLPTSEITLRGKRWNTAAPASTPALFVHGWLDNCNTFDLLAPRLPEMDIVALDLPGHGRSDYLPPAAHYQYWPLAGYLTELIVSQGWERIDLVGHCLGGILFLLVASAIPERINKIVLIDSISPYLGEPEELSESAVQHYLSRTNTRYEGHPVYPDKKKVFQLRRTGGDMLFSTAERLTERDLIERDGGFTLGMDPRLRRPFYVCFSEEQFAAYLARIRAPVLYIGAERPYQPDAALRGRQISRIKNIRYEEVPGGHYIHMENVDPVADLIRDFMQG
jgi:pimeloyl-ACP methyl ester carboxylesterase